MKKNINQQSVAKTYEFGGAPGAIFIILFSHFIIYYLWVSITYFQGALIYPSSFSDILPFSQQFLLYIYDGASPSTYGFGLYLSFIAFELLLAYLMPGIWVKGLPDKHSGVQHQYLCNGVMSWYATIISIIALQWFGLFSLSIFADHLGEMITAAIVTADILALLVYAISLSTNTHTPITGNKLYDFFIGTVLNPRLGRVDLKFFAEIRIAWILLFLLTLSAAFKQYQLLGHLTWPMIFMVVAHGLYTNACMKGEECIPTTWDIFHERWGWMLIFWNFAGVPFVYTFQSFYILKNNPQYPFIYTLLLFVILFIAYYIWDTSQSQKNRFRMQLRGTYVKRNTFPQLPWGTLQSPRYLQTKQGDALLIDGWWRYSRKIHYTADTLMALTWALNCGFGGILPYFYPLFFIAMITHRYHRDSKRCAAKYGKDWDRYCKTVPYRFIPFIF